MVALLSTQVFYLSLSFSLIIGLSTVSTRVSFDLKGVLRSAGTVLGTVLTSVWSAPFHMHTQTRAPFHSPWISKREPPVRKAAPPLGKNPFCEAFCHLWVLAQKMLKLLRQQGLFGLDSEENKSNAKQHRVTYQECHRARPFLVITGVISPGRCGSGGWGIVP